MEKIITALMLIAMVTITTVFSGVATYAAVATERTDVYALDYYKNQGRLPYFEEKGILELANTITAGMTSDKDKAIAICQWVADNIWYDMDLADSYNGGKPVTVRPTSDADTLQYKRSVCEGYARLTVSLLQAAGIPAKYCATKSHAWTRMYFDGRWSNMDTEVSSFNYYEDGVYSERMDGDLTTTVPSSIYTSVTRDGFHGDKDAWDGTLHILTDGGSVLKEVKNYPLAGLVTSTYGYNAADMYKNAACTIPWNFATDRITAVNHTIFVKTTPTPVTPVTAKPTASIVLVDGQAVAFDAYNIKDNNYFKLRDLAKVVSGTAKQFEVTWDGTRNAINLVSGKAYTVTGGELSKGDGIAKQYTLSTAAIYKDGVKLSLVAYTINGNNYFKLRDVAKAFNIGVTWDGATNTVGIDSKLSYTE